MSMTLEQFYAFAETLDDDVDVKKVAKSLGVELPPDPIAPLADQLQDVKVITHTGKATKRNPNPQEKEYVSVPSLKLSHEEGTRGFWINRKVARQIAERILEVCDE